VQQVVFMVMDAHVRWQ